MPETLKPKLVCFEREKDFTAFLAFSSITFLNFR